MNDPIEKKEEDALLYSKFQDILSSIDSLVPASDASSWTSQGTTASSSSASSTTLLDEDPLLIQLFQHIFTDATDSKTLSQWLNEFQQQIPRQVCQYPFRVNDIVWVCRTCQQDDTCVLCHDCFTHSDHTNHDVLFYHATSGGCCDCGDPDAWDPMGFCPRHGQHSHPLSTPLLPSSVVEKTQILVKVVMDWIVHTIRPQAMEAMARPWKSPLQTSDAVFATDHQSINTLLQQHLPRRQLFEMDETDEEPDSPVRTRAPVAPPPPPYQPEYPTLFSPTAASTGRPPQQLDLHQQYMEQAYQLGLLGSKQGGLYVVLKHDDSLTENQLYDVHVNWAQFQQQGQWTLLTPSLIRDKLGDFSYDLWQDGDRVTCTKVGSFVLDKCKTYHSFQPDKTKHYSITIVTGTEFQREEMAYKILRSLLLLARSCDPLCQVMVSSILSERHLVPLLEAEFTMNAILMKTFYSLSLTLLAIPAFKSKLSTAYSTSYETLAAKYVNGMGAHDRSAFCLSVQFLNRSSYVTTLVKEQRFGDTLGRTIRNSFCGALPPENLFILEKRPRLDPKHFSLKHRRYTPIISDLKCVLNVPHMPRLLIACANCSFLSDWITTLRHAQYMDQHVWISYDQEHVNEESRTWISAFNTSISLGGLYERLLFWKDDDPSPISDPSSNLSRDFLSCLEVIVCVCKLGILPWHQSEAVFYPEISRPSEAESPDVTSRIVPFSTIAFRYGAPQVMNQIPFSQKSPFSFHLPLHRFLAACLSELSLRPDPSSFSDLLTRLQSDLGKKLFDELLCSIMEYPLLTLSRVAQIRSELWRRNGSGLFDQVWNYGEAPFCRNMRDADLLLIQFCILGRSTQDGLPCGMAYFVNLLLCRLGLFNFLGLEKTHAIPIPYSPIRDNTDGFHLAGEFFSLLITLTTELPDEFSSDKDQLTNRAKFRLRREALHRLAAGPKTRSELAEAESVLSFRDSELLSAQGREINPDDAAGAALSTVLEDIAERIVCPGKSDEFHIKESGWELYDPSFFHLHIRHHQSAAEKRPKPKQDSSKSFGWETRQFCPDLNPCHGFFSRLRYSAFSDATVRSCVYRTLHLHCGFNPNKKLAGLPHHKPYVDKERSEATLAKVVQFLTLGLLTWESSNPNFSLTETSTPGSIFYRYGTAPSFLDWIEATFLESPSTIMACEWFADEEPIIILLAKLASSTGHFCAQDDCLRAGAAWVCETVSRHSEKAMVALQPLLNSSESTIVAESKISLEERKKRAKEAALARMKAQQAKFASMMNESNGDEDPESTTAPIGSPPTPTRSVLGNFLDESAQTIAPGTSGSFICENEADFEHIELGHDRLFRDTPKCIICNEDESPDTQLQQRLEEEQADLSRKRSKRRSENALGFIAFTQASTCLKGNCKPKLREMNTDNLGSPFNRVGVHVSLCGHAVHSECLDSYLSTVSNRGDRQFDRKEEFKCPLCQIISNTLIPLVDLGATWACAPVSEEYKALTLEEYLTKSDFWALSPDFPLEWDGHSSFVSRSSQDGSVARTIRPLGKKSLYRAWSLAMKPPNFAPRPKVSVTGASGADNEMGSETFVEKDIIGESLLWRRFLDQLADQGVRGDLKRFEKLGGLLYDYGEFRHYLVEKRAYNPSPSLYQILLDPLEWPHCVFSGKVPLSDQRRQELSREKLLAKLLISTEAFVYTCCSEVSEIRRIVDVNGNNSDNSFRSNFGFHSILCHGTLCVLPLTPESQLEDVFNGRLGKLRHLGLSLISTSGASADDLLQISFSSPRYVEPIQKDEDKISDEPLRAPMAFPILCGHVLTHTTVAICASVGKVMAEENGLNLQRFETEPLFGPRKDFSLEKMVEECEGLMKLGFVARVTQSLLGSLGVSTRSLSAGRTPEIRISSLESELGDCGNPTRNSWILFCLELMKLTFDVGTTESTVKEETEEAIIVDHDSFVSACRKACFAGSSFLADIALIAQVLVPRYSERFHNLMSSSGVSEMMSMQDDTSEDPIFEVLESLREAIQIEEFLTLISSPALQSVLQHWCKDAIRQQTAIDQAKTKEEKELRSILYQNYDFHDEDWPLFETSIFTNFDHRKRPSYPGNSKTCDYHSGNDEVLTFENVDTVPLLGMDMATPWEEDNIALNDDSSGDGRTRFRVKSLPASYTDLYVELAQSERYGSHLERQQEVAICLICGAVIPISVSTNDWVHHAQVCGSGAGILFMIQSCRTMLVHERKGAYYSSTLYVDSHGETPAIRGRPLHLDPQRYELLRREWLGHTLRRYVMNHQGNHFL